MPDNIEMTAKLLYKYGLYETLIITNEHYRKDRETYFGDPENHDHMIAEAKRKMNTSANTVVHMDDELYKYGMTPMYKIDRQPVRWRPHYSDYLYRYFGLYETLIMIDESPTKCNFVSKGYHEVIIEMAKKKVKGIE